MKKAQVTLFIILGILLLIGAVTFFYVRSNVIQNPIEQELIVPEQVPVEFDPVKVYVENCLQQTAIEGLKILGEQGGFISPSKAGFSANSDPTGGSAVRMAGNWIVPYWWHLSSSNKCDNKQCEFDYVPERKLFLKKGMGNPSIEGQMETYIEEHLNDCLRDFAELKQQGYAIEATDYPKVIFTVFDDYVHIGLNYPIEASKVSQKAISKFTTTINVELKNMYELSVLLTSLEQQYQYLDKYVMDLIVARSGLNKPLPPISDMTFKFGDTKRWSKTQVGQQIKDNILNNELTLLKVYGTLNYEPYSFPGDPLREGLYNGDMLLPNNISYDNVAVTFDYIPSGN